jgi:Vault protein inter-alpha-trypsin domain/Carboxypeptidase regulatory-like domain
MSFRSASLALLVVALSMPLARADEARPLSLAAQDGQELLLDSLSIRTAVHGMLSLTELDMTFRNPKPITVEGRFVALLPADAAVSRFAKEVNGQLMEGEVVERLQANQVYDTFLHQRRDPALLEQDLGNRFSARIFPINGSATVRVVLSYTRLLPASGGVRRLNVPLRGLPKMKHFTFRGIFAPLPGEEPQATSEIASPEGARESSVRVVELNETDYTADRDLDFSWRVPASQAVRMMRAGDFYLLAVRAPESTAGNPGLAAKRRIIYIDTSASGASGASKRIEAIEAFFAALPAGDSCEVLAFDQSVVPLIRGNAADVAMKIGGLLRARRFLGGTDLSLALHDASTRSAKDGAPVVFLTDGVATLGDISERELLTAAETVPALSIVVIGPQRSPSIERLVRGRGRVVAIPFKATMGTTATEAVAALTRPRGASLAVRDLNAEWVYPATFDDVAPGTEVIAIARVKSGQEPAVTIATGSAAVVPAPSTVPQGFEALFEREGYRAYIAHLADREASESESAVRAALAAERIKISVEHRVLIPETSMLVLESEADYQRFNLERRALAQILTIGATGVETLKRTAFVPPPPPPPLPPRPAPKPVILPPGGDDRIFGTVRDNTNGGLPGVSVTLVERASSLRRETVTDATGGYEFTRLGRGAYTVTAALAGFRSTSSDVTLRRRALRVDLTVQLGAVEALTVTAQAPPVEPMRSAGEPPPPVSFAPSPPPPPSMAPEGRVSATTASADFIAADTQEVTAAPRSTNAPPAPVMVPPLPVAPSVAPSSEAITTTRIRRVTAPPAETAAPSWSTPVSLAKRKERIAVLTAALREHPDDRVAFYELTDLLGQLSDWPKLRDLASAWQAADPDDPQGYEALGEAMQHLGDSATAERAFGSLVEIAPARPEMLQRAGLLLMRAGASKLAETPLRRAVALRPDRANAHRNLALFLWQAKRYEEAARVLEQALEKSFPAYYGDVHRILREELAYVYRSWIAANPPGRAAIEERAAHFSVNLGATDALRITMSWDTDANDVDLRVVDPDGEELFYSHPLTASGLTLYQDITQGFGPEVARTDKLLPGTYRVGADYYSSGPMGATRGVLIVIVPGKSEPSVTIVPFRLISSDHGKQTQMLLEVKK